MTNIACYYGVAHNVCEWGFGSTSPYADPYNEVEIDVLMEDSSGGSWRIPTYWAGGNEWRVRFAPPRPGRYTFTSVCNVQADENLHNVRGKLQIAASEGGHKLTDHGRLGISANRRHLEYEDGTPFFWLADTWWMGLSHRLKWPGDFQTLAADRVAKGFSVVQIVAGLNPDMDWGDKRGANEAGLPWNEDFSQLNPAYFDMADLKIRHLIQAGLMPCIVGGWGYFFNIMGLEATKKHWRNIIARWSAYPVIWCLCGEATYAYFRSTTVEKDEAEQKDAWTEIGRYVRALDPMHRLVTLHPVGSPPYCGRDAVHDETVMDFEMLQTFHADHESIPPTAKAIRASRRREPAMPVLDGEVNYEGIMETCFDNVQRAGFWICMLSGAAGHSYGANGIWQVNEIGRPYGPSSHDTIWGNRSWYDAMNLPGSGQLGLGKQILERYDWWQFEPHQEWISPAADDENTWRNYAAGIPGKVRVIYTPKPVFWGQSIEVCELEKDVRYEATFINPSSGEEFPAGAVEPDAEGKWAFPSLPEMRDWVVVLEAQ